MKKMDDAIKQLDDYNSQISTHSQKWLELEITMKSVIEDRIENPSFLFIIIYFKDGKMRLID